VSKETIKGVDGNSFDVYKADFGSKILVSAIPLAVIIIVLNVMGGVVLVWSGFNPQPYKYVMLILLPLLSIWSVWFFKGLLKLVERQNTACPNITIGFVTPIFGLGTQALALHVLNWSHFWLLFITVSIASFILFFNFSSKEERKRSLVIMLVFLCPIYGSSSVLILNKILDSSGPSIFTSHVLSKRVTSGRSTSYLLKLSSWSDCPEEKEVSVMPSFYNSHKAGDSVEIYEHEGKFGISWYEVSDSKT
jgi:hypothetical protein